MSNKNLCILFTGQGSQYPEMGLDLSNNFKWVKDRYKKSSDILGYDVLKTQQNHELINLTEYSQPMIFILSSIIIDIFKHKIIEHPSNISLAGHSLGEYCALYYAEALGFEEMLTLVKTRGESMSKVSDPDKYAMHAILKKDDQKINEASLIDGVYIANLNSDKQIVICGLKDKLEIFRDQNPIGKFIPLNVSAPFHSELMLESSKLFLDRNKNINFNKVNFDLISNHQLKNYKDIPQTEYINQLSLQIHSPVMWSDTIKKIIETGVSKFIEIGPKKTLLNFIPKGLELEKLSITNNEDIDNYV
jgi:malonyl CoA-acyl carrier protein transacylase